MTTAHRPTFHNALGCETQPFKRGPASTKVCSRDLPGQRTVKERKVGQWSSEEVKSKETLKAVLEAKETSSLTAKRRAQLLTGEGDSSSAANALLASSLLQLEDIQNAPNPFPEDADDEGPKQLTAAASGSRRKGGAASGSDDDSEDDEEAELLRELENIKRERREEEGKKKQAEAKVKEAEAREQILRSNPLMVIGGGQTDVMDIVGGGTLNKSWEDDTVFKNQAKLSAAQKADQKKKKFINDPVRSAFHQKFLQKYIV